MKLKVSLMRRFTALGGDKKGQKVGHIDGKFEYSEDEILALILADIDPTKRHDDDEFELWLDAGIHD